MTTENRPKPSDAEICSTFALDRRELRLLRAVDAGLVTTAQARAALGLPAAAFSDRPPAPAPPRWPVDMIRFACAVLLVVLATQTVQAALQSEWTRAGSYAAVLALLAAVAGADLAQAARQLVRGAIEGVRGRGEGGSTITGTADSAATSGPEREKKPAENPTTGPAGEFDDDLSASFAAATPPASFVLPPADGDHARGQEQER